jgi:PE family
MLSVTTQPEALSATAANLAGIAAMMSAQNSAAAAPTTGGTDRHERARTEHRGYRSHRSQLRRDVGPGRHRDVRLRRLGGGGPRSNPTPPQDAVAAIATELQELATRAQSL